MELLQVIDMNEDTIAYNKQQDPPRVKVFTGDTIYRDSNPDTYKVVFDANIVSGGFEWRISFPIEITISSEQIFVETMDSDNVIIEDEDDCFVHSNHNRAMSFIGITYEDVDKWATEYCLK